MRTYSPNCSDDYVQECNSYMEIKYFLSNRISEQEREIQRLKDMVLYHSTKHIEMYEWIKNINNLLQRGVHNDKPLNKSLNFSGEFVDSLSISEENNENDKDRFTTDLKNENLKLTKKLEVANMELINKNLTISRLQSEKIIVLGELNELLVSLKRVDLNSLNRFYLENCKNDRIELPNALGLKYNILSAQSQVAQINANDYEMHYKENDYIDIEKYCSLLRSYTQDFKDAIDKNTKRFKLLDRRNSIIK
jgi:hypothetical protein